MPSTDVRNRGRQLRSRSRASPAKRSAPHRSHGTGRRFVGVATKSGKFANKDVLDQFSLKSQTQQLQDDLFQGIQGIVEPLYNPESLALHLEANTYHARCVRTKAQDTAGQGWDLQPLKDENPSEQEKEELVQFFEELEHDITEVLVESMIDRESVGYLAIEIARENKEPEGPVVFIKNIPAHTMRAHEDRKRFVQERGAKRVWFKKAGWVDKDVHKRTGEISEAGTLDPDLRANEVLWNNIYTSRSDIYGVPDHIPAIGAILGDIGRRDFNISFFDNYGVPAYAVFVTGDFDPGDPVDDDGNIDEENGVTPMQRKIEEHVQDLANNPHSVLVMSVPSVDGNEVEIEFTPLSTEVKEASFRLFRMDNMKEVLSAHAVPPYRAGIAEQGSLGGNVAENMDEIYRDSVLGPRQQMLERLINGVVLRSHEVTDWEWKLLTLDTTDDERELNMAIELFDHAALTPNDLIRNFGSKYGATPVDNVPAMDAHYLNGQPLDAVLASEVEATLMSVRNRLLEVATKHVETSSEDDDVGRELVAVLASIEGRADPATAHGGGGAPATQTSVLKGDPGGNGRTGKPRVRAGRYGGRPSSPTSSNGHG